MPGKLIPGEKKTPIYKKSSGFKMKSSIAKNIYAGGGSYKKPGSKKSKKII